MPEGLEVALTALAAVGNSISTIENVVRMSTVWALHC